MKGKRRKFALGDSIGNYSIKNPLSGSSTSYDIKPNIGDPYYSSNSLNSLSTSPSRAELIGGNGQQGTGGLRGIFNSGTGNTQNAIGIAASAVSNALSAGQEKGIASNTVEGVANAVPLWGQLFNLTRGVSGKIRGDKTDPTRNAIANVFSPSSGVTDDIDRGQNALLSTFNPIAGGIRAAEHYKRKALEEERVKEAQRQRDSESILSNYPIYGTGLGAGIGKYGMKFPNGGRLPYPTDGSQVNQLASNIAQYNGATHEQGGIDLDINSDASPEIEIENKEVIKDDMVLSNRLSPSKDIKSFAKGLGISPKKRETYASLAARIGKKKGDFEGISGNTPAGNSARLMTERLDTMMDMLFMDQQSRKFGNTSASTKFPGGGKINTNPGVPSVSGPIYAPQDSRTTPEQNAIRARNNLYLAQRFRNAVGGNNLISSSDYEGIVNANPGMIPSQQTGGGARNYTYVDPKILQKADSVVTAGLPYLPKFPNGDKIPTVLPEVEISDTRIPSNRGVIPTLGIPATVTNPLTVENYIPRQTSPLNVNNGYGRSNNGYFSGTYRERGSRDWQDYRGDLAALLGTGINQAIIGSMEANYNPETVQMPLNTYTDRTGYLTSVANQGFRSAAQGVNNSSVQDNLALKSNLYSKSLQGLGQALDSEFQRKDANTARFNELVNRTNMINADIRNKGKLISMENRNKKKALTQANVDNLIRSYIGNEAVRDFKKSEYAKNYLNSLKSGERGVDRRTIENLPKDIRKTLGFK